MLILDRSAPYRCGPPKPSKAVNRITTRVGVLVLSVIEVIQQAMMESKQIATAATPQRGSVRARYELHVQWRLPGSPSVQPPRCAGLTALLHEPPGFRAGGAAAPRPWMR